MQGAAGTVDNFDTILHAPDIKQVAGALAMADAMERESTETREAGVGPRWFRARQRCI